MITQVKTGTYRIALTRRRTKVLHLDEHTYIWLTAKRIGDILVATHKPQAIDVILSSGHYCMYQVEDEPGLTDVWHLELQYSQSTWQGYLLPTGLPSEGHPRRRIIPTHQIISGNAESRNNFILHRRHSLVPIFPVADIASPARQYTYSFIHYPIGS